MKNKDTNGMLDDDKFFDFLNKITAFIWAYSIVNPGVNALRTPVYAEMTKIIDGQQPTFNDYKFNIADIKNSINNYKFYNGRPITKSMLAWWAF